MSSQPSRLGPAVAAALLLASAAPGASAATSTATMAVSATVLSLCTITALPLAFGNYTGATLDATATLTVICTASTTFDVGLDPGLASGATVSTRKMNNGLNTLNYSLFRDASRTVNWGTTVGTDTASGVGSGLPQTMTVYGRVGSGQFVTPGAYTDVITATITY